MEKSDIELLAEIAQITHERAREVLSLAGGFRGLPRMSYETSGLTLKQFERIKNLFEFERRHLREDLLRRDVVRDPESLLGYLNSSIRDQAIELFSVTFLDKSNSVIATEEMFHGTIDQTAVYPREVIKRTLEHNATAVILAHNHPSGRCEPSIEDRSITQKLQSGLALIGCAVTDHIIAGGNSFYSFREHGLLG